MVALLNFTTLVFATLFAAVAAVALHWVALRAALQLMQPATAGRRSVRTELARGTTQAARAFLPHRRRRKEHESKPVQTGIPRPTHLGRRSTPPWRAGKEEGSHTCWS
jgi:hypothetical protein